MNRTLDTTGFRGALLDWYGTNRRDLPWRRDPTPYRIWISEVMAQQTQLDRVVRYYERWLERFPDLATLAAADEDEVLKLWEGLGYYNRARALLAAARQIRDRFGGVFPDRLEEIRSLPGVGEYTAGAIASIAFGVATPAVDANVLRVLSRLCDLDYPLKDPALKKRVVAIVLSAMPADRRNDHRGDQGTGPRGDHPGVFNQALMELGALICTRQPACDRCPVNGHCESLRAGVVAARPAPVAGREPIPLTVATGILLHEGEVLIQKRRPDDAWPGLWEFPGGIVEPEETPVAAVVREFAEEVELEIEARAPLPMVRHTYTHHRVSLFGFHCVVKNGAAPRPVFNAAVRGLFVAPEQLEDYAFPAGHRKLIDHLFRHDLWQEFSRRV